MRERERDANYQGRHHVGEQMQRGDDGIESTCVRQDAFAAGHIRPFVMRGCECVHLILRLFPWL